MWIRLNIRRVIWRLGGRRIPHDFGVREWFGTARRDPGIDRDKAELTALMTYARSPFPRQAEKTKKKKKQNKKRKKKFSYLFYVSGYSFCDLPSCCVPTWSVF